MNEKLQLNSTYTNLINYEGVVSVKIYRDNKLIKDITKNNHGTNNLFRFIGYCLQGKWGEVKDLRPCKIVALSMDEIGETDENIFISNPVDHNFAEFWSSSYAVSPALLYNRSTATIQDDTGYSITYNFRIPSSLLSSGKKIKKLVLVPSVYKGSADDIFAYYILDEELEIDKTSNYTLIVDWKLIFKDKNSEPKAGGNE